MGISLEFKFDVFCHLRLIQIFFFPSARVDNGLPTNLLSLFPSSLKTVGCILGQNQLQRDIIPWNSFTVSVLEPRSGEGFGLPCRRSLPLPPSWNSTSYRDGGSFPRIAKKQRLSPSFLLCSLRRISYPNSLAGRAQYLVDRKAIKEAAVCLRAPINSNGPVVSDEDEGREVWLPPTGSQMLLFTVPCLTLSGSCAPMPARDFLGFVEWNDLLPVHVLPSCHRQPCCSAFSVPSHSSFFQKCVDTRFPFWTVPSYILSVLVGFHLGFVPPVLFQWGFARQQHLYPILCV